MKRSKNGPLDRKCDFCGNKAIYDAPTYFGPWAYACEDCIKEKGAAFWYDYGVMITW